MSPFRVVLLLVLGSLCCPALADPASRSGHTAGIGLGEARSILQAGFDFLPQLPGVLQCIVVLDAQAELKAAACVDNAIPIAQEFAIQKARTAVSFGAMYNTTAGKQQFLPLGPLYKIDSLFDYTTLGGAIPLFDVNGTVRGAVGVSGAFSVDQDISVAVASLAGVGGSVSAAQLRVPSTLSFPFLSDTLLRLGASEQAALAMGVAGSLAIYNDAGRYALFYRMDGSLLATGALAMGMARACAITHMNTSDLAVLAQPGSAMFTFDNSNNGIVTTPGGLVLVNNAGHVLGGIAAYTATNSTVDTALSSAGLSAQPPLAIPAMLDSSISMPAALAVANAALAAAAARGATLALAVVGRDTVPRLVVATDGVSPLSVQLAIKKAQTAVYLPVPTPLLSTFVRPPPGLYDLAVAQGGLVTYSGVAPLGTPGERYAGGVGIVTDDSNTLDDNISATAASVALAGQTAATLALPATPSSRFPIRTGSEITLAALLQTCTAAAATSPRPAVCAARDATGTLRYLAAADGVVSATVDFAVSSSATGYFSVMDPSQLQSMLSPTLNATTGQGLLFTADNAFPQQRLVALPGGTTLVVSRMTVGALGLSSGLSSPLADENAALAGAAALPTFYNGPPECPMMGTLRVVDAYLTQLFVYNNVSAAATYTAGANFTLTWHGPTNLVPIAGTFSGTTALPTFFGNVFRLISNFQLNPTFAPDTLGVRTVSADCATVVKQWQEVSVVTATGKAISNALNTVVYVVRNGAIQSADVYVDSMQYAQAFCAGQVACVAGAAGAATAGAAGCDSDAILASVRGFGATILVLVVVTLLFTVLFARQPRPRVDPGVPYSAM